MSGATFILAMNLAMSGLIAAVFLGIASYDRTRVAGHWLAGAYGFGVLYYLVEFAIRFGNGGVLVVAGGAALLLLGMTAFNIGVAVRYGQKPPLVASLLVVAVGTLVTFGVDNLERYSFTRMMAFQGPYFLMQMIAMRVVLAAPARQATDSILALLLGASALHFLSKPFLAHIAGGWGANPGAYLGSNYAMVSQSLSAVFSLAVALMTMTVLVREMLSDATAKSETDTLSGLHNRGGFETRAALAIERAGQKHLPVSLVIADLDHFKAINDTYGHASGDRVLVAFARFLQQASMQTHVTGRIGGEEFAVLLPGVNLAAARLFAEGARAAFASMSIDGLPEGRRFTASFGVAELDAGEGLVDLMRRADDALYRAKREGRDRVRVSNDATLGPALPLLARGSGAALH